MFEGVGIVSNIQSAFDIEATYPTAILFRRRKTLLYYEQNNVDKLAEHEVRVRTLNHCQRVWNLARKERLEALLRIRSYYRISLHPAVCPQQSTVRRNEECTEASYKFYCGCDPGNLPQRRTPPGYSSQIVHLLKLGMEIKVRTGCLGEVRKGKFHHLV